MPADSSRVNCTRYLAGMEPEWAPVKEWIAPPREPSLLLDNRIQNCTLKEQSPWEKEKLASKRRARGYQRAMSGLRSGGIQMWTLTTSVEAELAGKCIQASFRALVMRLRRRGLIRGYMRVKEFTQAGRPHLHVLFRTNYIEWWWLRSAWTDIHLSPVVRYDKVRGQNGMARYLAKYLGKDPGSSYSWSWDWVWKGFVADWKALCREAWQHGEGVGFVVEVWSGILDMFFSKQLECT